MSKIKLENVNVRYRLTASSTQQQDLIVTAADNINLIINKGDRVGLVGRNGSGKSTLLSLAAGNLKPHSGTVMVEGEKLALINRSSGLVPNATLYENALIKGFGFGLKGGEEISQYANKVLNQSKLLDRADSSLRSLSTGMTGRFNIALNSQVIKQITVLDEWVGTLDVSGDEGNSLLNRITSEAEIVLLASHNDHLIRQLCNRIILLEQGTIIYDGMNFGRAYKLLSIIKQLNVDTQYSAARLNRFLTKQRKNQIRKKLRKRRDLLNKKRKLLSLVTLLKTLLDENIKSKFETAYETDEMKETSSTLIMEPVEDIESPDQAKIINVMITPKSGRWLVKKFLDSSASQQYKYRFHQAYTPLQDIPSGELLIIFLRNPIERFCRSFYARKQYGAPVYAANWSAAEAEILPLFSSPESLVKSLMNNSAALNSVAVEALLNVKHLSFNTERIIGSFEQFQKRREDIFFVGDSDNIFASLGALENKLEIVSEYPQHINPAIKTYFETAFSQELGRETRTYLDKIFLKENQFIDKLQTIIA